MTDNGITAFTLDKLFSLAGQTDRRGVQRGLIVADRYSQLEAFRFPCRIEAIIIGIGIEGETTVQFNLNEYRLKKDTLFWFGPQNILQTMSDEGFHAHVIAISTDLLQRVNIDTSQMLPLFLQFGAHPVLDIAPEESAPLHELLQFIEREVRQPQQRFGDEMIGQLLAALIYKTGNILDRQLTRHPETHTRTQDRAETYFRNFIPLLGKHFRRERSVGFYARQLCITPKYLTTLIKRVSGKSVSEWIDIYVTLEAKTLLRFSDRSIQEVAYALNFPNQSFFGSYFRRTTGMSPSEFRATKA